jgi:hypothetical protein
MDGTWSSPGDCIITPSIDTWHIDVIYDSGTYYMLINRISGNGGLFLAMSTDGVNFDKAATEIFTDARPAWCEIKYRSALVRTASGFDVWISAHNISSVWKVGYSSIA